MTSNSVYVSFPSGADKRKHEFMAAGALVVGPTHAAEPESLLRPGVPVSEAIGVCVCVFSCPFPSDSLVKVCTSMDKSFNDPSTRKQHKLQRVRLYHATCSFFFFFSRYQDTIMSVEHVPVVLYTDTIYKIYIYIHTNVQSTKARRNLERTTSVLGTADQKNVAQHMLERERKNVRTKTRLSPHF